MSRVIVYSMLLPFVVPPLVFFVAGITEGVAPADTWTMLIEQYGVKRTNLLMCSILGLAPVALLLLALGIHRLAHGHETTRRAMGWGGFVGIALVLVWVNVEYWPRYLPSRAFLGFPHGLEFVIGPLFFAPVAALVGMLITWYVAKRRHA